MTEIWMARHGETDWNRERRLQGQSDNPLNERGREQAAELGRMLREAGIAAVYSSDLPRAAETAAIVAAALRLPLAGTDPRLRERDMGAYHGMTYAEAAAAIGVPLRAEGWVELEGRPGVESYDAVAVRALAALGAIAEAHRGLRVLVITHGALMGAVRRAVTGGEPGAFGNGSLLRLAADAAGWRLLDAPGRPRADRPPGPAG